MTTNSHNTLTKAEIFVNEIVFNGRNDISLLGFVHHGGQFFETEYSIERTQLETLLTHTKTCGNEVLRRIEQLFAHPHAVPASINLIDLFGTTQALEAKQIVLTAHNDTDSYSTLQVETVKTGNTNRIFFL
jgi:hypothetical protein